MTPDTKKILLTGGGSGGHVYPLVAVAQALRKIAAEKKVDLELTYFGPKDRYSAIFLSSNINVGTIPAGKIRRYFSPLIIVDIPKFFIGLLAAFFKMFWIMPDAIFSKGGTGALPVVIAGWFYGVPIIIHESDASPGLNNLLSAPFASRIAVSFEEATKYFNSKKVAWIGSPLRSDLIGDVPSKEDAKEALKFNPKEKLTVVLGGSQGSDRINKFLLTNLVELLKETQVLHQTGAANFGEVEQLSRAAIADIPVKEAAKTRYQAVAYLEDNLKPALSAADLVITRAGSGTIFEISAFGKPAILIPLYESANGHQMANAREFAKSGAAVVIEEPNLLPSIFISQVKNILKNNEIVEKMSAASKKFFKPGAAEVIAQELLRVV